MPEGKHTIRPVRILPWDVGTDISKVQRGKINLELKNLGWHHTSLESYCRDSNKLHYKYCKGYILTLDIFDDGFSIFCIHDPAKILNEISDFDPISINKEKTDSHCQLLSRQHFLSEIISMAQSSLWSLVPDKKRRSSASNKWENSGISYVFSVFLISTNSASLRSKSLKPRCMALLFPMPASEVSGSAEKDQAGTLEEHTSHEVNELLDQSTIVKSSYKKQYFSWATSILAGPVNADVSLRYLRTMREIQHAWFSAYIGNQLLSRTVEELPNISKIETLIDLDSKMSKIGSEVAKYTSIPDSMATSTQLRSYRVAAAQSGLNDLAFSVDAKLQLIRNEITSRIERRNVRGYRSLEMVLALLTFIQAVSAYKTIESTGGLTIIELTIMSGTLIFLLIVLLFR
ncbi:MAG: hypothetical protein JAZ17_12125 [Candidatus Thiodiazotropha endolucinida]|nr:hypothetical protein [Candidatus Thiodiazotropha endolucinida]